ALVPLTFDADGWQPFATLSGVSLEVVVKSTAGAGAGSAQGGARAGKSGKQEFLEDLLFTHRGLSGPAILQISSYWNPGEAIQVDLAPHQNLEHALLAAKPGSRQQLGSVLAGLWPKRLADQWLGHERPGEGGLGAC